MNAASKNRIIFLLTSLLAIGVFLVDLIAFPSVTLPAIPYAIPILIAAYYLPPRLVAGVGFLTLVLELLVAALEQLAVQQWAPPLITLAVIAVLSVLVSMRTKREAALAEEHERFRRETEDQRRLLQTVIDNASVGIALLRVPGFFFEIANPAYQAIAPGKTLLGRSVAQAWPELAPQVLPLLERVQELGEPYSAIDARLPVQRAAGAPIEEVYFTFTYVPLFNPEGRVDAILVLVVETTEQVLARKRVEELAEMSQRRAAELQSVLDNMLDGVFVWNAEGRVTLANEAGLRMAGVSGLIGAGRTPAEMIERFRLRHADGKPMRLEELPQVRALSGETIVHDDEIMTNQQTGQDVYIRVSAAPIKDDKGMTIGAVAVVRDITGLTELERLKDQFINVAAHELKTPVTTIKGYAQFLVQREHEGVSPPGIKVLQAINRQADRISGLVNDLLDVSRLQAGELGFTIEQIDLPRLVEDVIDRAKLIAGSIVIRLAKTEPAIVKGDRGRVEQVMINLLENAVKFSPKGGEVEVVVATADHEAIVSVTDHGVGIPKEKQPYIFQRFYRAHAGTPYDYGGMGVGLYISKEIVTRLGGRIWFDSEPGKGSTFYFSLPMV